MSNKRLIITIVVTLVLIAFTIRGQIDCWSTSPAESFWGKAMDCGG